MVQYAKTEETMIALMFPSPPKEEKTPGQIFRELLEKASKETVCLPGHDFEWKEFLRQIGKLSNKQLIHAIRTSLNQNKRATKKK